MKKLLTDTEVAILSRVASVDGLELDFTYSDTYAVYILFPRRKVGFINFHNALNFISGYHEAKLESEGK